jgi:endogenous inhibitor of DNA gyrase (YacG/DUF329 family)
VLAVDGDRVECHACGRWFRLLASHVFQVHGLFADEYRSIFGLRATTGLAGPAHKAWARRQAQRNFSASWPESRERLHLSPEQRTAYARARRLRLESKLDPANHEVWRQNTSKAHARKHVLLTDPDYRARINKKLSDARGGRVLVSCAVCGTPVARWPSQARRSSNRTCGRECARELRRRLSRELQQRPAVRAKQRRGRPLLGRLLALPPAALDALGEADRALLRGYYGLAATPAAARPPALAASALAGQFGLSVPQVRHRLQRAVAVLLGRDAVAKRGTVRVPCAVCGTPVERHPWEVGKSRPTCSPACLRALRQHLVASSLLRPEIRAKTAAAYERRRAAPGFPAQMRAQAREAARRRERPGRVQLLAAFEPLPARDRRLVRRYYGLDGEAPLPTQEELAREMGLTEPQVARLLRQIVARLLGPEAPSSAGWVVVPCAVCGMAISLQRSEAQSAEEHACSKACFRELRRRKISGRNPWAAPEVRAKARVASMERERPHRARLQALPPEAFTALPEPDRTLLRLYYGLEADGQLHSARELATRFGLTTWRVSQAVARSVTRLLGQEAGGAD